MFYAQNNIFLQYFKNNRREVVISEIAAGAVQTSILSILKTWGGGVMPLKMS